GGRTTRQAGRRAYRRAAGRAEDGGGPPTRRPPPPVWAGGGGGRGHPLAGQRTHRGPPAATLRARVARPARAVWRSDPSPGRRQARAASQSPDLGPLARGGSGAVPSARRRDDPPEQLA